MDSFPKKACKFCGGTNHFPYACYRNPKNMARSAKGITSNKKHEKAWIDTRLTWIRKNPPPILGTYWECYLKISPLCPLRINERGLTLDHVVSRSRDPSKRYDPANLRPCCWYCNGMKGSLTIEAVEKQSGKKITLA